MKSREKARSEASPRKLPSKYASPENGQFTTGSAPWLASCGRSSCKRKSIGRRNTLRRAIRLFRQTRCNPSTAPSTAGKGGNPTAYLQLVQNLLSQEAREAGPGSPQGHEAPRHTQMAQAEGRPLRFAKEPVANLQSWARSLVSAAKMLSVYRSGYNNNNHNNNSNNNNDNNNNNSNNSNTNNNDNNNNNDYTGNADEREAPTSKHKNDDDDDDDRTTQQPTSQHLHGATKTTTNEQQQDSNTTTATVRRKQPTPQPLPVQRRRRTNGSFTATRRRRRRLAEENSHNNTTSCSKVWGLSWSIFQKRLVSGKAAQWPSRMFGLLHLVGPSATGGSYVRKKTGVFRVIQMYQVPPPPH